MCNLQILVPAKPGKTEGRKTLSLWMKIVMTKLVDYQWSIPLIEKKNVLYVLYVMYFFLFILF